jgi:hypothetical protein
MVWFFVGLTVGAMLGCLITSLNVAASRTAAFKNDTSIDDDPFYVMNTHSGRVVGICAKSILKDNPNIIPDDCEMRTIGKHARATIVLAVSQDLRSQRVA